MIPDGIIDDYLSDLIADRVLVPSPHTPAAYFNNDGTVNQETLRLGCLVLGPASTELGHQEIAAMLRQRLASDPATLSNIWLDVVTDDCFQFLVSRFRNTDLERVHIPLIVTQMIREQLTIRSAQKMYYVLYAAGEQIKAFLTHHQCKGRKHAINSLPNTMRRVLSRFEGNPSLGQNFRRLSLSRSSMGRFFFEVVLNDTADAAFSMSLTEWRETSGYISQGKANVCPDCGSGSIMLRVDGGEVVLTCDGCGVQAVYVAQAFG